MKPLAPYAIAIGGVIAITAAIALINSQASVQGLSAVYVLLVLWLGARWGRGPAVTGSFAAFLLYMVMVADGPSKTAHYAICTGFMALGMMLPGMASGWIQEQLGYAYFFIWVCIATIPSFIVAALVDIDPRFGRKHSTP